MSAQTKPKTDKASTSFSPGTYPYVEDCPLVSLPPHLLVFYEPTFSFPSNKNVLAFGLLLSKCLSSLSELY